MEDCDIHDREFKRTVIKKLNRTQENSERQFSEIMNKINEEEHFTRLDTETLKKN